MMRSSETDRALICPASLVLPRVRRPSGDAALYGTFVHYWKEVGDSEPEWASESHKKTFRKKLAATLIDRDEWWPPKRGTHEVAFALHLLTCDLLMYGGLREGTDAWKKDFSAEYLTGTIDWYGETEDGLDWIEDLKTGAWPVDVNETGQLLSYALVPWVGGGMKADWEGWVSICQWPRYKLDCEPVRSWRKVTALDLREHLDALRYATEHPDEVVQDDDACRFCECKAVCPAFVGVGDDSTGYME